MERKIKLELTFDPLQAEAFASCLEATALSLLQQKEILNKAIDAKDYSAEEGENLQNFLLGTELQAAITLSIKDALYAKLDQIGKSSLIIPDSQKPDAKLIV